MIRRADRIGCILTITLLIYFPSGIEVSAAATASDTDRSELLTVISKDGTRIAVECAGAGPTLLFVHGGVGDRTRWTPMFPLLSQKFTVCAMDRRGHGAS